jgi:hypothetical protein
VNVGRLRKVDDIRFRSAQDISSRACVLPQTPALDCGAIFRRATPMKKTVSALLAVATIAGSLVSVAPAARADGGRIAAGVAGGLIGGALLGGAIAASRPAYGAPAPVYVEEPPCRMVRERYWDDYRGVWRTRPVEVCD